MYHRPPYIYRIIELHYSTPAAPYRWILWNAQMELCWCVNYRGQQYFFSIVVLHRIMIEWWTHIISQENDKGNVVILMKFSSMNEMKIVNLTTFTATSDVNSISTITFPFQWESWRFLIDLLWLLLPCMCISCSDIYKNHFWISIIRSYDCPLLKYSLKYIVLLLLRHRRVMAFQISD